VKIWIAVVCMLRGIAVLLALDGVVGKNTWPALLSIVIDVTLIGSGLWLFFQL
jgi:hypothetical protein